MAIVKVGTYRNPPVDITDYEAIVSHLDAYTRQVGNQGMILTEWTNTSGTPAIAMGSYISHGGVLYVVDSEEAVSLPVADGTYYLKVAASGDTMELSWVSDISGYTWNAIANGLYHADESQVLPYQLVKNGALIEKYKMLNPWQNDDFSVVDYLGRYHGKELRVTGNATVGGSLGVTGSISGASVGVTGNATVGGTLGFASLNPDNSTEISVQLSPYESQVLPKGAYAIKIDNPIVTLAIKYGSDWFATSSGFVISDGVNFRLSNASSSETHIVKIRKW